MKREYMLNKLEAEWLEGNVGKPKQENDDLFSAKKRGA